VHQPSAPRIERPGAERDRIAPVQHPLDLPPQPLAHELVARRAGLDELLELDGHLVHDHDARIRGERAELVGQARRPRVEEHRAKRRHVAARCRGRQRRYQIAHRPRSSSLAEALSSHADALDPYAALSPPRARLQANLATPRCSTASTPRPNG
jgi:hypothetical protein